MITIAVEIFGQDCFRRMMRDSMLIVLFLSLSDAVSGVTDPRVAITDRSAAEYNATIESHTRDAVELMRRYAARTGLIGDNPQKRYLWTDAFAVCNYLGLARTTGEPGYHDLALELIDRVHQVLGRHRQDDPRQGWISGLDEAQGEKHPTIGGLRIGKEMPERGPGEIFDQELEWDRDGQYFHYLMRWAYALDQAARTTRDPRYNRWARELAETAVNAFSYSPQADADRQRMYWKMSIDLSRPQVLSMGRHDPLEGYIGNLQLMLTAAELQIQNEGPDLVKVTRQLELMLQQDKLYTQDALGIGGMLVDAYQVMQLLPAAAPDLRHKLLLLLDRLLTDAIAGLQDFLQTGELRKPAQQRYGFRELGLSIGLHAVERMQLGFKLEPTLTVVDGIDLSRLRWQLAVLGDFAPVAARIETFWLQAIHSGELRSKHQDITEVMLATSLAPAGYLDRVPLE